MFNGLIDGHAPAGWVSVTVGAQMRGKANGKLHTERSDGRVSYGAGPHGKAWPRVPGWLKGSLTMQRKPSAPGGQAVKLFPQGIDQWVCSLAVLGLLLSSAVAPLVAAPGGDQPAQLSARELVEDVVRKEKEAREHPQNYYKFVQKETTPKGSKTSVRIETPKAEIGAAVSVDDKPPSETQCRNDASALKKLATDSDLQRRQLREQKEENERIDKLMAAVPQAFIFQYKGKQQGAKWREITFRPNPRYQPPSRETALLKGMQGTLWVDLESHRLVKIQGTLIKDVNFGWGFLASIHSGGRFALQQSKVPGGSWKATFLKVDLDGSKLVFGQIHVHFKDTSHSYVPLASPPTLTRAVKLLQQSTTACRKSQGQSTTAEAEVR